MSTNQSDSVKVLYLTLRKQWFDMILSGEKKEEYREIKPYWTQRLQKLFDIIEFRNGYSESSPRFRIELRSVSIGYGNTQWGAPKDQQVYILELGKILSPLFNCLQINDN